MEYIHYGSGEFKKEKFTDIKNREMFTKPERRTLGFKSRCRIWLERVARRK